MRIAQILLTGAAEYERKCQRVDHALLAPIHDLAVLHEKGRSGLLVPPGDPNELAHAILAALFKPEVAEPRIDAARQTISKFRPRQRLRVLAPLYETLLK